MKRRVFCILLCTLLILVPVSSAFAIPTSGAELIDTILSPIGYLFLQISSFFLWLSGILLNYSINFSVVHFKDIIEKVGAIEGAWKILRDVANIFFVIAILKVGFQNILGGKTENIGKVFENLVIAAIGINFSILIATTAIDVSNAFALHFYRMVVDPIAADSGKPITLGLSGGVTGKVMDVLGIQSFFSDGSNATKGNDLGSATSTPSSGIGSTIGNALNTAWWIASPVTAAAYDAYVGKNSGKGFSYFLMGSAIILVIAFSFCVAAIMFAYRAVAFIVLLITAPFAFMGYVLPEFKKQQGEWRNTLEKECMWPPLYFLALYIGMQVLQSDQFRAAIGDAKGGGFVGLLAGDTSAAASIFNFIVVTTIFNGAMIVANKYSPEGLNPAKKYSTKLMNGYLGSALSASAYTSRKTVGALGQKIGGNLAESDNRAVRWLGNSLVTDSKRSFDLRNIAGFEAGTAGLISETSNNQVNASLGKPGEYFGYKPKTKEEKEKEQFEKTSKDIELITEENLPANDQTKKVKNDRDIAKKKVNERQKLYAKNPTDENKSALDQALYEYEEAQKAVDKEVKKARVQYINQNITDPSLNKKLRDKFEHKDEKDAVKNAGLALRVQDAILKVKQDPASDALTKLMTGSKGLKKSELKIIADNNPELLDPGVTDNIPFLNLLTAQHMEGIKESDLNDDARTKLAKHYGEVKQGVKTIVVNGVSQNVDDFVPNGNGTPSVRKYFSSDKNWDSWGLK